MELPIHYDWKAVEKKLQQSWEKNPPIAPHKQDTPEFSIDTPPPTLSGRMHMGHAFSYSQGDFIARYKRMRGHHVFYPFGTDDNGLPTERLIEKQKNVLATSMKRQEFIDLCSSEVEKQKPQFIQDWIDLGISADFKKSYSTISPHSIKTSQASFIDLMKKGLVYKQDSPTMWCPTCQTAIAQADIDDVEMSSHFNDIVFKLGGKELIIGTTRPEMIPACVALLYHPSDHRYKECKGKFATIPLFNEEVPILEDEKVDPEKGTGMVMCCTFGDQTDVEWWRKYNLPLKALMQKNGKLNQLAQKYAGLSLKEARKEILKDLQEQHLLLRQKEIIHAVKVHERCQQEIEFLKTSQWFIRVLDKKQELLDAGDKIQWYPDHMKIRYKHWVENLQWDWCISRQRPFGVPFPVWYSKKTGKIVLADESQLPVDPTNSQPKHAKIDPDDELLPETDVMDTWATSSVTPEIVMNWVDNYSSFKQRSPMSLRLQAHDIIRTWAFYTIVKSLHHHSQIPWRHIAISGHALDAKGKKMSKSKGNVIDPQLILEKYGADCLRWWTASSKLGEDVPFQEKELVAGKRLMTKLWNASRFIAPHLDIFDGKAPEKLHLLAAWLISKLQHIIAECTKAFERYDYSRTKIELEKFFWHTFCDNYLELVKERLYNQKAYREEEVRSAIFTLATSLLTFLKMFAPIMPHITEELYQTFFLKFGGEKSIHQTTWGLADKTLMNDAAEKIGDGAVEILAAARKQKTEQGLALNAPVKKLSITFPLNLSPVEKDLMAATKAEAISFAEGELKVSLQ